jgi:hypothetical protein
MLSVWGAGREKGEIKNACNFTKILFYSTGCPKEELKLLLYYSLGCFIFYLRFYLYRYFVDINQSQYY